jgi:hypothetical protein
MDLPLDEYYENNYHNMKNKHLINLIILKIVLGVIKVVKTDKIDNVSQISVDESDCCYIVYSTLGNSQDTMIKMERIFLITYTPEMSLPTQRMTYEMQSGKKLLSATRGAMEMHVRSKKELLTQVNAVLYGKMKATSKKLSDDEEEDEKNDNWMDD